jgi:hypothetical protein
MQRRDIKVAGLASRWGYLAATAPMSVALTVTSLAPFKKESALYLPAENNVGLVYVLGLLALIGVGLFLWGGIRLLQFLCRRSFSIRHAAGMLLLIGGIWLPSVFLNLSGRHYKDRLSEQLLVVNEASYLGFAEDIRKEMEKKKDHFITFDSEYSGHAGLPVSPECERILGESPLTIWPRRFLGVRLEKDSVILSRGTGMLGQIGVIIFDKGPLREPRGPDYPRPNSYFPTEYKLTNKVFVFTSD